MFPLLLTPVFWLFDGREAPVYGAIFLSAAFGVVATVLAGAVARQHAGNGAALIAMALISTSPAVIRNTLSGLEASLAGSVSMALLLALPSPSAAPSPGRLALLGSLAGLALLTRLDAGLMALIVLGWSLFRLGVPATLRAAGIALLILLPWFGYCLALGTAPLPETGGALRHIAEFHRAEGLSHSLALYFGATTLAGAISIVSFGTTPAILMVFPGGSVRAQPKRH